MLKARLIRVLVLLLASVSPAFAVSAFVSAGSGNAASGTTATTAAFNTTGANTLHAVAVCRGAQPTATFSDSQTNSWTVNETTSANTGDGDVTIASARAFNITASASHTVTITWSASCGSSLAVAAASYSGLITTDPFDVDAGDTWTSTATPTSNTTATTTQANELVIGSFVSTNCTSTTVTAGSGYTERVESATGGSVFACVAIEDKNVSSTGTQVADFALSPARVSAVHVATYKDAAAGGVRNRVIISGGQ